MVIVKYVWNKLTPSEKVTYGGVVKGKMTENSFFPDANTVLVGLGKASEDLDAILKAPNSTVSAIREKEQIWDVKMKAVAMHVQGVANEVNKELALEIVQSAGLTVRAQGGKALPDTSAEMAEEVNTVKLHRRKKEKGNIALIWQMCTDTSVDSNWKQFRVSTIGTIYVKELLPATEYWFRVAIVIGDVQGPFSNPFSIIVS